MERDSDKQDEAGDKGPLGPLPDGLLEWGGSVMAKPQTGNKPRTRKRQKGERNMWYDDRGLVSKPPRGEPLRPIKTVKVTHPGLIERKEG
ncbi:MAG: hypothetical protein O6929_11535 [candidate division NC10 bacterium]|nr:hypothetical protein [candidate division NC10 bacterium]